MPIVSSAIVEDAEQRDKRRSVREQHIDDQGRVHEVIYLAEAGVDVAEMLPIRAAQIDEQLTAEDAQRAEALAAEKYFAETLLKLPDESIAAILKVPLEKVAAEKGGLQASVDAVDAVADVKVPK